MWYEWMQREEQYEILLENESKWNYRDKGLFILEAKNR